MARHCPARMLFFLAHFCLAWIQISGNITEVEENATAFNQTGEEWLNPPSLIGLVNPGDQPNNQSFNSSFYPTLVFPPDLKPIVTNPFECQQVNISGHQFMMAPDQTCKDRCDVETIRKPCFCDDVCLVYGDCCLDYEVNCLQTANQTSDVDFESRYQAQKIALMECIQIGYGSVLAISRCPTTEEYSEARELCDGREVKFDAKTELIRSIPFVKGDLFYSNVYCAICTDAANWDDVESLGDVTDMRCFVYIDNTLPEEELFTLLKNGCTYKPKERPPSSKNRPCGDSSHNAVSQDENARLCQTYSARVKVGFTVYNNLHCALLHEDSVEGVIDCLYIGWSDPSYADFPGAALLPSFAMLLDLGRFISPIVISNETCQGNFSWSPVVQGCVSPPLCFETRENDECWHPDQFTRFLQEASEKSKFDFMFVVEMSSFSDIITVIELFQTQSYRHNVYPLRFDGCRTDEIGLSRTDNSQVCIVISFFVARSLAETLKKIEQAFFPIIPISRWIFVEQNNAFEMMREKEDIEITPSNCSIGYKVDYSDTQFTLRVPVLLEGTNVSTCLIHEKVVSLSCSDVRVLVSQNTTETLLEKSHHYMINDTAAYVCLDLKSGSAAANVEGVLTVVCQTLSIVSLILTLCVYGLIRSLRTVPGRCVMCLCCVLLMAQIILQFGSFAHDIKPLCIALAALDHWAWLASFCWMVILAYDISSVMSRDTLTDGQQHARQFRWYLVLAFGAPTLVVASCLIVSTLKPDLMAYTDGTVCWISSGMESLLFAFALPVSITLVLNTALFVRTLLAIRKAMKIAEQVKDVSQTQQQLVLYVRLASLMGFTWALGLLQNALPYAPMRYAFIVCNALQGVGIMTAFVCKRRVLRLIRARLVGKKACDTSSSMKSRSTTVTAV